MDELIVVYLEARRSCVYHWEMTNNALQLNIEVEGMILQDFGRNPISTGSELIVGFNLHSLNNFLATNIDRVNDLRKFLHLLTRI